MYIMFRNKILYRVTLGKEVEPQQPLKKLKYLNKLDEAFGFMCIHISRELLFHLDGLKTLRELWKKIESLFGKKGELRGHILENELISLQPNNFETIQQFFSKFKSLVMQCKQVELIIRINNWCSPFRGRLAMNFQYLCPPSTPGYQKP